MACELTEPKGLQRWQFTTLPSTSSVRIIYLVAAENKDDPLECRFIETTLESNPQYNAVSYCWGDEADPSTILCHGKYLPVTRNLDAALRRFRQASEDIPLWIDSICINQQDIIECHRQVYLMGDIYHKASKVLIWLGCENEYEDSPAAMEYMQTLLNNVCPRFSEVDLWKGSSTEIYKELNIPEANISKSSQLKAFNEFFRKRPWFDRAWTYQESRLARTKTFYCGRFEIPYETMLAIAAVFFKLLDATNERFYLHFSMPKSGL